MTFDIIDIPAANNTYGTRESTIINSIIVHSVGLELKEVFKTFNQ